MSKIDLAEGRKYRDSIRQEQAGQNEVQIIGRTISGRGKLDECPIVENDVAM